VPVLLLKGRVFAMSYIKSSLLDEKGFVILDSYDQAADPQEWKDLEYVD